jgi:hypothetical protein
MLVAPLLLRARDGQPRPLCGLVAVVRWLAMGAAQSKTALLLLQPLHAVTFGAGGGPNPMR